MNNKTFAGYSPTWCPGCGNWGILAAIKAALSQSGLDPADLAVVFGIGCSGNMNDFLNAYAIHSLHGRAIPNAIGIKLANHHLPVIAVVGDGDCYGEGGNHFLHACRGNHNITVIVHDNRVYGLTTGQAAPTSPQGYRSKSTPLGIIEQPVDPLLLALTQGATFVSQAFAGDLSQMTPLIKAAVSHRGFSLVNILQPCVSFNKINTYQYYLKRVHKLPSNYQKDNLKEAVSLVLADNQQDRYPLGILYQRQRPTFVDRLPQLKKTTLIHKRRFNNYHHLLDDFS